MTLGRAVPVLPSVRGPVFWQGDAGYEAQRQAVVWNGLKPARYPAVIVQALDVADVVAAVRWAAGHGLRVKARSGGHNWTASFLRDGAMLIDLAALDGIEIDVAAQRLSAGPAVQGARLQAALLPHRLFFPTGHCSNVCIGGYLLQGGFGWNGPALGLANGLLDAVEVVTAAGAVICASATEHSDHFWAARGAGAGFFGIVTRYFLRVVPQPALRLSQHLYTREQLPQVLRWATRLAPDLPHQVELNVFILPDLAGMAPGGFALVNLMAFAATGEEAEAILQRLDTCPLRQQALVARVAEPVTMASLYEMLDRVYAEGMRYVADNMFTNAAPDAVAQAILQMAADIPTPMSHVLWHPFPRARVQADTSLSIMGENYLVGYGACADPRDDAAVARWAPGHMRRLESLAVGMQLGDENLLARPHATVLRGDAPRRLEALRRVHDPQGLFLSYLKDQG